MLWLTGIVLSAVLLRTLFLGKPSLWWDEAASVHLASMSWPGLAREMWREQANMAFYYALLHLWLGLGNSEFGLRALSVLFASATVPLFYVFGARMWEPRTGLVAAVLLAFNVFHVRYAQEARSYALLVLLVTLASLVFVSAIRRPAWRVWAGYITAIVLAVYSHVFGALVLLAHSVSIPFLRRRDIPWRFVGVSAAAIVALLIPLAVFAAKTATELVTWIPHPSLDSIPRTFVYLAGAAPASTITSSGPVPMTRVAETLFRTAELGRRLLLLLYAAALAAALAGAAWRWRASKTPAEMWPYVFLLTWLLVPPVIAYLVSLVKPIYILYYLIVSLPPLIFLVADGLARIQRPSVFAGALVLLGALGVVQALAYYDYGAREDWRNATAYILGQARPGDGLVFYTGSGSRYAFEYYRHRLHRPSSAPPSVLAADDAPRDLYPRLWLVLSHADAGEASVQSMIATGRTLVEDKRFFGIRVLLYRRSD